MRKVLLTALLISNTAISGDLEDLAEAIYFESRGEPVVCQVILAQSILNRVKQERFPDTIEGVIHQKNLRNTCQYSYYCDGLPDRIPEGIILPFKVASMVLYHDLPDFSNGADHFYAQNKVYPDWAPLLTDKLICNNHTFGQLTW